MTTANHSVPYQISRAMLAALTADPALAGAALRDNPTSPAELADGDRVLFLEDGTDAPIGQQKENQKEFRSFVLSVGVINRSADARSAADLDMVAVRGVMAKAWQVFMHDRTRAGVIVTGASLYEGQRSHKIEGIDVGGALIVTTFEFQYREASSRPVRIVG